MAQGTPSGEETAASAEEEAAASGSPDASPLRGNDEAEDERGIGGAGPEAAPVIVPPDRAAEAVEALRGALVALATALDARNVGAMRDAVEAVEAVMEAVPAVTDPLVTTLDRSLIDAARRALPPLRAALAPDGDEGAEGSPGVPPQDAGGPASAEEAEAEGTSVETSVATPDSRAFEAASAFIEGLPAPLRPPAPEAAGSDAGGSTR